MKKLTLLVTAFVTAIVGLLPLLPVQAESANLLVNPSVEQATNGLPSSWLNNTWGTNTSSFVYDTTGHSGSRSLTTKINSYSSGDAKWYFKPVSVKPNTTYTYSDWFKGNVTSSVDVVVTNSTGTTSYLWQGDLAASPSWKQASYSFKTPADAASLTVYHYIDRVGQLTIDDASLVDNTQTSPNAPRVTLGSPLNNGTVSGTVNLTAHAEDAAGIAHVQFKLDGVNLGSPDSTSPFSLAWDTTKVVNGTHTLAAVATNKLAVAAASPVISVTVQNGNINPSSNLIANPSVEQSTNGQPTSWLNDSWGTNSHSFTYDTIAHTGSRSLKATVSSYSSGDAKWYFNSVPVTAGKAYNYSNWYQSNVASEIDAMVTMSDGSLQYVYLADVPASSSWRQVSAQFTVPAGAVKVTIFQIVSAVGFVRADDFSLMALSTSSPQFNRAIVSLTFDDGWRSIYANGLPILRKYSLPSTQYLNSDPTLGGWPDYMSYDQIKAFSAQGSELAWHTRSHTDLTKLSTTQLTAELTIPLLFLNNLGLAQSSFTNFASPYGAYNPTSVEAIKQYYKSHRSTDQGYNTKVGFNRYNLKVQNITSNTTTAQVRDWVSQAVANKAWLILVYHEVSNQPHDITYSVTPANLDAELSLIKQSGVSVQTVRQGLNELIPQL